MARSYDDDSFGSIHVMMMPSVAATLLGTVATTAALVTLGRVPPNVYGKITGAALKVTNGGTGAATGPQFGIGVSLAGTGDIVVAASAVYGTRADNTFVDLAASSTASETAFLPGDVLSLCAVAGTVNDVSQVISTLSIDWQETYS